MIVSTNRPYFAPFVGFFQKAYQCDILIILDSVQFPQGTTWITRNRFKNDQGTLWMTIPVWKKGLGLQSIDDVRICHDSRKHPKHLKSLKQAYANAPYFPEHFQFVQNLFTTEADKLIDFNMAVIRHLMLNLGIDTKIIQLSDLHIKSRGDQLLIDICNYFNASSYVASSGADKYLNGDIFDKAGIKLHFFNPRPCVYPQLWGQFIPNLSAFDLLFNCGPKARDICISSRRTEI